MNHEEFLEYYNSININRKICRINKNKIVKDYLLSHHKCITLKEALYQELNNINEPPKCPVCNSYLKFINLKIGYNKYCNSKCSANSKEVREKTKETCLRKYGVENYVQTKEYIDKTNKTCLEKYGVKRAIQLNKYKQKRNQTNLYKYGVEHPISLDEFKEKRKENNILKYNDPTYNNKEKAKETCLKKYGVINAGGLEQSLQKIKNTCLEKYGVENPYQITFVKEKIKKTCLERYGVENYSKSEEYKRNKDSIILKAMITKKNNRTFNTSKPEEDLYVYIKEKFPLVKRQYKDKERYPYFCDFYIPELDLFLELNATWTHNNHPFNPDSKMDQNILNDWKNKSKEHPFYLGAIDTWTIRDVNKRNMAKENKLNFKEVWSLEEGKKFIDEI